MRLDPVSSLSLITSSLITVEGLGMCKVFGFLLG